eukprot:TRINITY_DN18229_c0_g1_i1.p1 TRINITY_DN18229_c0_g1~~TRINITY_DN18229_c0_g1_i1.p1  ORF type:complete len:225 (-),score=48.25 TRINITY_DN18229_c0_g1_i1:34-708(-)
MGDTFEKWVKDKGLKIVALPQTKFPKILFVGEGDWSFSFAFVAWRGVAWTGITTSMFASDCYSYSQKIIEIEGRLPKITVQKLLELDVPEGTFRSNVDAEYLKKTAAGSDFTNIWFQCPWSCDTRFLLQRFFKSASEVQKEGDHVYITIATIEKYFNEYDLRNLNEEINYELEGYNTDLVQTMLLGGYRHKAFFSGKDIHDKIAPSLVTLIWKRNNYTFTPESF